MLTYDTVVVEQTNPYDSIIDTVAKVTNVVLDNVPLLETYSFDGATAEADITTAITNDLVAKGHTV